VRRALSSPRIRRRLLRGGLAAAGAGALFLVVALMPSSKPSSSGPTTNEGPAQLATPPGRLRAADRQEIDATLDRFIQAAVLRRSAATAWSLAGPELKTSSSLADWRAGNSPVPYYPAKGTTFHDWRAIDVSRNAVVFNLLVHPRSGSKLGTYVFSGQVVRHGSRWLVNRWYTIAVMNPVRSATHEIGPADFEAPPPSGAPASHAKPTFWRLAPVIGVVALAPLVLLAFGAAAFLRGRRWRRMVAAGRTELPPLPHQPTARVK
jgi:hypothetical protein